MKLIEKDTFKKLDKFIEKEFKAKLSKVNSSRRIYDLKEKDGFDYERLYLPLKPQKGGGDSIRFSLFKQSKTSSNGLVIEKGMGYINFYEGHSKEFTFSSKVLPTVEDTTTSVVPNVDKSLGNDSKGKKLSKKKKTFKQYVQEKSNIGQYSKSLFYKSLIDSLKEFSFIKEYRGKFEVGDSDIKIKIKTTKGDAFEIIVNKEKIVIDGETLPIGKDPIKAIKRYLNQHN